MQDNLVLVIIVIICIIVGILSGNLKREEEKLETKISNSNAHIQQDYEKVMRVLDSCKNEEQLISAERLVINFKNKHKVNEAACKPLYVFLIEYLGKKSKELS